MIFQQESQRKTNSDSDSDFENGDNKKEGTELEIVDGSKLEVLISEAYRNFDEKFMHMSIKQKTNYFVRILHKLTTSGIVDYKHCANEHLPLFDKWV